MGDRSRSLSSSGLRLLLRLVSVVAALVVLSISSRASATPLAAVGMCGDNAESIAAPPIFRSVDGSSLSARPCQAPEQLGFAQGAPVTPERVIVYEAPERVLPFAALRVTQSESSRLAVPVSSCELERPGFAGAPFRPPQA
ncbi:MAG TPA: hypothetical protein VHB79_06740 [Polyangiaceae bacterium]|nr:hypothetical protein [Polyangiaceae bacterium]